MKKVLKYVLFLCSFFLISCSSAHEERQSDGGYSAPNEIIDEGKTADNSEGGGGMGAGLIGEKVIRTIYLAYETLAYEEARNHLNETIRSFDSYVEYSYESSYSPSDAPGNYTQKYRQLDITVRVPSEHVNEFLDALKGMDAIKISEQNGTEDVTQNYRDTETRIAVLQQKEQRLNELLEKAETVEQILQIEDSLSQTIAEREILQDELDRIDDLIDYTAVHLQLIERQRISYGRNEATSFWERIKMAVLDSLYSFYYWMQDAAIWLIYAIPFVAIAVLVFIIIIYVRRAILKKRKDA